MISLLSFDIEEWFHGVPDFSSSDWPSKESTLEAEFDLIAGALTDAKRSATFFVLEEVARAFPQMVKRISDAGWEVASHGSGHGAVYESDGESFREGLRRSVGTLEDISGEKVLGYRAPMWSIMAGAEWAIEVLLEEGIQYDSSLLPSGRNDPAGPFLLSSGVAEIIEVPPAPLRYGPFFCPMAGGFSQRIMPRVLYRPRVRRAARDGYLHSYFHPWELTAARRDLASLSFEKRFFFSVGRKACGAKYRWLLEEFDLTSIGNSIAAIREAAQEVHMLADIGCHAVRKSGWLQGKAGEGATR